MSKKFQPAIGFESKKIRFKNCLQIFQGSIFTKNLSRKLNSNSLEGHKVLKLATQLPQPWITIPQNHFNPILQTFQNLSYIGEMRQRWEEIKKLQQNAI